MTHLIPDKARHRNRAMQCSRDTHTRAFTQRECVRFTEALVPITLPHPG